MPTRKKSAPKYATHDMFFSQCMFYRHHQSISSHTMHVTRRISDLTRCASNHIQTSLPKAPTGRLVDRVGMSSKEERSDTGVKRVALFSHRMRLQAPHSSEE